VFHEYILQFIKLYCWSLISTTTKLSHCRNPYALYLRVMRNDRILSLCGFLSLRSSDHARQDLKYSTALAYDLMSLLDCRYSVLTHLHRHDVGFSSVIM
jgi:hypothetical protein